MLHLVAMLLVFSQSASTARAARLHASLDASDQAPAPPANQRLGEYTAGHVQAACCVDLDKCDAQAVTHGEQLLMLIQEDFKKMLRFRHVLRAQFDRTFSEDFATSSSKKVIGVKGTIGLVGAACLGDVSVSFLAELTDGGAAFADTIVGMSLTSLDASKNATARMEAMKHYTAKLLSLGANLKSPYWPDVQIGHLYEAYVRTWRAMKNIQVFTPKLAADVMPVRLKRAHENVAPDWCADPENPDNTQQNSYRLPENTRVEISTGGSQFSKEAMYDSFKGISKDELDKCVRIKWEGGPDDGGFVPLRTVAIREWHQYLPDGLMGRFSSLPIFAGPGADEAPDPVYTLRHGDFFVVVERQTVSETNQTLAPGQTRDIVTLFSAWRLADGRGWVRVGMKTEAKCRAPAKTCAPAHTMKRLLGSERELQEQLAGADPDPSKLKGTEQTAALSRFKQHYSSNWCFAGRFLLKGGLFAAGFFTFGVTWVIGAVVSVANASTAIGLHLAESEILSGNVGFFVGVLAAFEKEQFQYMSRTRPSCDILISDSCRDQKFCLARGVFMQEGDRKHSAGFCVSSLRQRYEEGSPCLTEFDCRSGYCDMNPLVLPKGKEHKADKAFSMMTRQYRKDAVSRALMGQCRTPCAPASDQCTFRDASDKFGIRNT